MTKKLTCVYSKKMLVIPGAKYIVDKDTLKELKKLDAVLYEKAVLNREESEFFLRFVKTNGSLTKTAILCTLKGEVLRGQELYVTKEEGKERKIEATKKEKENGLIEKTLKVSGPGGDIKKTLATGIYSATNGELEFFDIQKMNILLTILKADPRIASTDSSIIEIMDFEERKVVFLMAMIAEKNYECLEELLANEDLEEIFGEDLSLSPEQQKLYNLIKAEHYKDREKQIEKADLEAIRRKVEEKLDGEEDSEAAEEKSLSKRIKESLAPEKTKENLLKELKKARRVGGGPEYANIINWIETNLSIPYSSKEEVEFDLKKAKTVLDSHHYGLEEVKERILEIMAVQKLSSKIPVICLSGPAGVGKSTIAKSIAEAMGREFVKVSLGGVNGESDIRGHRKTYVGAMSGRIVKGLIKAGCNNPVMLLDEIDKLAPGGYNGDPAAALLELLDPSQNKEFQDHYIENEVDFSKVMFIATANYLNQISGPLLDRMELIELEQYTVEEKIEISKQHLIKNALEDVGLTKVKVKVSDESISKIIEQYTLEAGVRELQRQFAKICNKLAVRYLTKPFKTITLTDSLIEELLGAIVYRKEKKDTTAKKIGSVNGLAWTAVGGRTLDVQAITLKTEGKGGLSTTGNLKAVMKESTEVAYNYLRTQLTELDGKNFHLHFPAGATPKDGPSAGITIATALYSAATNQKVRQDVAMTGEISIFGEVLPIGGVKEKVSGAFKQGIKEVILPEQNRLDAEKIAKEIREQIVVHFVKTFDEVKTIVFGE